MGALVPLSIEPEIIAPGERLTVVVLPHPLLMTKMVVRVAIGDTLAELVNKAMSLTAIGFPDFEVSINGAPIDRDVWRCVRPKPGTVVIIRAVAGFDDASSVAKTVVGVAGMIAGAFNPFLGAAVSLGGTLVVGALFPPAKPVLAPVAAAERGPSQVYSLSGSQNSSDPFGVIPVILGRHRVYPKLGARPYTEFVGADQYLRMLFVWGYGPLEISAIKIGETPITDFSDVEIETRYGYPDDAPITLYPNEVVQDDLSIDLTVAGGAQQRTTAADIDEISLDVVAPSGVLRVDANNAAQTYEVQLRVDYSPTGTGAWALLDTLTFSGRSRDQIRKSVRKAVANGQYDVRITKTSADYAGSEQVEEQVVWTALRGFRNSSPIEFDKPLAVTAVRIRATSQLNGALDDLNGMASSKVKAYSGAAWLDDTASSWPHDLFRSVLQHPANSQPQADDRIGLANLERWSAYNFANGFTFNMVRDFKGSVYDTLKAIAAAGRADLTFSATGAWDVIWDEPDAPIVQHFTPRNSWGFSGERAYRQTPHGFRVRFINEDVGYQQDERIVYDDGYTVENASLFEGLEFPGRTKSDLVWRDGRFQIAQARLRPEQYRLNVDFEHLVATRGDRVRIVHDVAMFGLAHGRVVSTGVDGDNDVVTIDEPLTMAADTDYAVRFRLADGSAILRNVITNDGTSKTLTLEGHGDLPDYKDLAMFGVRDQETVVLRILKILPGADVSALLVLVDDAPEISTADQGVIPAFDSHITVPVDRFTAPPIDLGVQEAFAGVEGATVTGALFYWATSAGEAAVSFDVEYRDDDGDLVWKSGGNVLAPSKAQFLPGLLQGLWSFRVRCVFADGSVSQWAELSNTTITAGGDLILPDVTNFVTSYDDSTAGLKWDKVKFSKLEVFYEIRRGDAWDIALTLEANIADPPVALTGNGTYWIKAKAQPLPGITIYSQNAVSLAISGAILVRNVLASLDERGNGWTGTKTGAVTLDGTFLRTTAAGVIAYYEIAADRIFDNGYLRPIRIESTVDAVGLAVDDNFLANPDVLNTQDIFGSALTQQIEVWVEIAEALDLNADVYAGQDVYASPDVYAGVPVFTEWRKFVPGQYLNRFSKLRLAMRSNDEAVNAVVLDWIIVADVADRLDSYTNLAVPAAGVTVTFVPKGGTDPKPFKGGPDGAPGSAPHYQITILDAVAGDKIEITSAITIAAITFRILNAGVPVDRVVNLSVQGY